MGIDGRIASDENHFVQFRFGAPEYANRHFLVGSVAEQQIVVRVGFDDDKVLKCQI